MQVPNSFVPDVTQSPLGSNPFQGQGVQPMRNAAPEQMQQMGAATQHLGQEVNDVAIRAQSEIDSAKIKAAESQFIQSATEAQSKYLETSNADALAQFAPTQKAIIDLKQEASESLDNEVQRTMFNNLAQRHLAAIGAQMDQHQTQQRKAYNVSESAARADSMRTMAQNVEIGSKDQTYSIENGVAEVRKVMASKGFPADSAEAQKAERDYRTQITGDNVNRLMVAGKYDDAKTLLGDQMKAGNVDPDAADHLRSSIESNVKRVETVNKADEIFAQRKGLEIPDLEALLSKTDAIADPEMRKDVRSEVMQSFSQARNMQQQAYKESLDKVVNYKAEHGSIRGVDPTLWGQLDAKDREELSKPPAVETDVNTMVGFILHPDTATIAGVQDAYGRGKLAKGTYLSLLQEAQNNATATADPEKIRNAQVDENRIHYFANQAGLNVFGPTTQESKTDLAALTFMVKGDISAEQQAKGRMLTLPEKDEIVKKNLAKRATLQLRSAWNPASWFGSPVSPDTVPDYSFRTRDTRGVEGPSGRIRQAAIDRLSQLGIKNPTDDEIDQWYVEALKNATSNK